MKLVADESVEGPTVLELRRAGHSVLFIAETSPGIADSEVLLTAHREGALLLTADKDFGDLVFHNRSHTAEYCSFVRLRTTLMRTRRIPWLQFSSMDLSW